MNCKVISASKFLILSKENNVEKKYNPGQLIKKYKE